MRVANQAPIELVSPCSFGSFGTVIVNHTGDGLGDLVCIGANNNSATGNPTLHGEIAAINNCTAILSDPTGRFGPVWTISHSSGHYCGRDKVWSVPSIQVQAVCRCHAPRRHSQLPIGLSERPRRHPAQRGSLEMKPNSEDSSRGWLWASGHA